MSQCLTFKKTSTQDLLVLSSDQRVNIFFSFTLFLLLKHSLKFSHRVAWFSACSEIWVPFLPQSLWNWKTAASVGRRNNLKRSNEMKEREKVKKVLHEKKWSIRDASPSYNFSVDSSRLKNLITSSVHFTGCIKYADSAGKGKIDSKN